MKFDWETIKTLLIFLSLIVSTIALIVSILNYRRDKYKVLIDLDWDNGKRYEGMRSNVKETWGTITVRNIGRRPVFILSVGLKYPDDERVINLLGEENLEGVKLEEHDKPIIIKIPQDFLLKRHSKNWDKIYAIAYDIAGKEYKSEKSWTKPSWAE